MHIVSEELIAGHPAIEVRHFLRRYRLTDFYIEAAEDALVLSPRTSTIFMNKLKGLGFVDELGRNKWNGRRAFRLTIKGQALANASAARLLHRKTAERLLAQFLERVQRVNSTQEYVYRVEHVVLFGSILSDTDRLGDVDVAVQLQPKVDNDDAFQEWSVVRRRAAEAKGRNFRTVFDWAMWPTEEIFLQLKARSRGLRLHDFCEVEKLPNVHYKVLLGDPQLIAAKIESGEAV
jgi:predicted nucleotidyltransferase